MQLIHLFVLLFYSFSLLGKGVNTKTSLSPAEDFIHEVAVIGSGPAGLGAALITAKEKAVTIIFSGDVPGGPVNAVTCMGNWPGSVKGKGKDVIARLFSQVEKAGATVLAKTVIHGDFSKWPYRLYTSSNEEYVAKTVIIATGSFPNHLEVEGEEEYFHKGIETLVYKNDGHRFVNKSVAIVGGGIDAIKKASIIAKTAKKVYLIVRGKSLQKNRWKRRLEKFKDKVEVFYHSSITKIIGNGEFLTRLELTSGNTRYFIEIDSLVLACGISPNSQWICNQIDCDSQGFILLKDRSQKTNLPGVFAAGGISDPVYRQAAISSGDGMKAGYDALEFLKNLPN